MAKSEVEISNDSDVILPSQAEHVSILGSLKALHWQPILAISTAMVAQILLEPPGRQFRIAIPIYMFSAAFALWSFLKKEWEIPALPTHENPTDSIQIHAVPLLLSVPFLLATFWEFGGGKFTGVNLVLWMIAIALLFAGLWIRKPVEVRSIPDPEQRLRNLIWFTLIIALLGLIMFFRLNQIENIPDQPFSDHAEKILDVYDISQGKYSIFFPRNTGREAIQMYWSLVIAKVFGTGISFLTLKLGTAVLGLLTLPYIYLLGKEYGSPRAGLFALFLFGIAYWPNVISRMGLRFTLYPLFLAPTLLYLTRGLRTGSRNDFLLCGLFLGLGLHGYTPFRIVPFVVLAGFVVYALHSPSKETRPRVMWWMTITSIMALYLFLPLLRYALDHPEIFSSRAFSRLGNIDLNTAGSLSQVFLSNLANGLLMFNWDDGGIWVNSLPHRPALDVVTGALFVLGIILLIARYIRGHDWRDLFLLLTIPLLLMPSVLSLAFPDENPALNRAGGAAVSAILVSALALDGLASAFFHPERTDHVFEGLEVPVLNGVATKWVAATYTLTGILLLTAALQNYDLVFRQFNEYYLLGVWNTSKMGEVIREFKLEYGTTDSVWIIPYSQWVDTRLPGMWIGILNRDFALWPDHLKDTKTIQGPKMFIFKPEDSKTENALKVLYPEGTLSRYTLAVPGKDFMVFLVEK